MLPRINERFGVCCEYLQTYFSIKIVYFCLKFLKRHLIIYKRRLHMFVSLKSEI